MKKNILFTIFIALIMAVPAISYWDSIDQFLYDLNESNRWVQAEGFEALTNGGASFAVRQTENCPDDECYTEPSWRVQTVGTQQWRGLTDYMAHAFGPSYATRYGVPERVLFEFQSNESLPIGITLNAKGNGGGSISLTNESTDGNPCLVIRYENTPEIIGTIPEYCME